MGVGLLEAALAAGLAPRRAQSEDITQVLFTGMIARPQYIAGALPGHGRQSREIGSNLGTRAASEWDVEPEQKGQIEVVGREAVPVSVVGILGDRVESHLRSSKLC